MSQKKLKMKELDEEEVVAEGEEEVEEMDYQLEKKPTKSKTLKV